MKKIAYLIKVSIAAFVVDINIVSLALASDALTMSEINKNKEMIETILMSNLKYVLILLVVLGVFVIFLNRSQKPKITSISKSTIEKILAVKDLWVLEFTYEDIATLYEEDLKEELIWKEN